MRQFVAQSLGCGKVSIGPITSHKGFNVISKELIDIGRMRLLSTQPALMQEKKDNRRKKPERCMPRICLPHLTPMHMSL